MHLRRSLESSLLLAALTLLVPVSTACAVGDAADSSGEIKAAGILTVKDDCRILTDPNGRKYALVGKLEAANGEHIRVTGKKADRSKCLDGPAIRVEKLEKLRISQTKPEGSNAEPEIKIVTSEATGPAAAVPMSDGEVRQFFMRGALNDEVKVKGCQGFRNLRGELWALTGDLKGFKTGDKVQLEAAQVATGECGVPTLKISTIEAMQQ